MTAGSADRLAVYVHWPFCLTKCPYCDFNSHVRDAVPEDRWRRALIAELGHFAGETSTRQITSIFFGGGTPSLIGPATVGAVIGAVGDLWALDKNAEITLEANPTSVEAARFRDLREAGVNRVSLGIQALDDDMLKFLGRGHSAAEAIVALEVAQRTFPRSSFDLIYARPGQTVAAWRDELARALSLAGEHMSLYQLTVEKGTPFYADHRRGAFTMPVEDTAADLFDVTQELMEAAGMPAYEISNHARPGAECRHNLAYWRTQDCVGAGPGAHGRLTGTRGTVALEQIPAPENWLDAVEAKGHGTRSSVWLSETERLQETVMMGLRLKSGIAHSEFEFRFGRRPEDAFDADRVARLTGGGFLILDADGLRTTGAGRARLNAVIAELMA